MVSISVKITKGEETVEYFMRYSEMIPTKIRDFIRDLVNVGRASLSMNISQRVEKSGSVLAGVFSEVDSTGKGGSFGFRHPAAVFLEKGTIAHDITAVNRKVLKFERDGRTIFAPKIKHPGYRGKDLVEDATKVVVSKLIEVANEHFDPRV